MDDRRALESPCGVENLSRKRIRKLRDRFIPKVGELFVDRGAFHSLNKVERHKIVNQTLAVDPAFCTSSTCLSSVRWINRL